MTRCIHCTRCVRFGQEIAGVMELGMIGRSEHAEIVSFVGRTVDSELSGNMIDLCPVGALTSKPFRYAARTWELARRKSVSPHDGLGANLVVQVKNDRVMRVLPLDNEAINECWLSDKDRFGYEALGSEERLVMPRVKENGEWREVDWATALEVVARGLKDAAARHGGNAIGVLASPHATFEELALAATLARALGGASIDHRLRQADFSDDRQRAGVPWLGMPIAAVGALDRALLVGSFLRKDHPLIAQRLRQAAQRDAEVATLHAVDDEWLMPVRHKAIVAPSLIPSALAGIVVAAAQAADKPVPGALAGIEASASAQAIAASLLGGSKRAVFLGNAAVQHAGAAQIRALAQALADIVGATLGTLVESANAIGAAVAGAEPDGGGANARAMLAEPRKVYLVLHVEPELDCANPVAARAALAKADLVVVMSPFAHGTNYADVLLPIAPFTETAGTFVNCEGRVQSFNGVVKPLGEARPGWKVLRVLGTMLGLPGFAYESIDDVRRDVLPEAASVASRLSNATSTPIAVPATQPAPLERIADIPIYFADPLVRRAESLQRTADAKPPRARMHRTLLDKLGIADGAQVRIRQGQGEAIVAAVADPAVPPGVVRLAAAHPSTCGLEGLSGPVSVERA
ncbi:MAG: molybdopterin-dependent oxidoreductase, partial [Betaproteobacteria bacterium]